MPSSDVFDRLMEQIHQRARELPAGSYTTKLITGGVPKMGAKVQEEAAEVVDAAASLRRELDQETDQQADDQSTAEDHRQRKDQAQQHLIYEAGDVLYHLWVLLGSFGITVEQLRQELARREGMSGLEEKRRRSDPS